MAVLESAQLCVEQHNTAGSGAGWVRAAQVSLLFKFECLQRCSTPGTFLPLPTITVVCKVCWFPMHHSSWASLSGAGRVSWLWLGGCHQGCSPLQAAFYRSTHEVALGMAQQCTLCTLLHVSHWLQGWGSLLRSNAGYHPHLHRSVGVGKETASSPFPAECSYKGPFAAPLLPPAGCPVGASRRKGCAVSAPWG